MVILLLRTGGSLGLAVGQTGEVGDRNVTVGLDIGTTSVKGLAVDDDGHVLAQVRVPHPIGIPSGRPLRARRQQGLA